MDSEIGSVDETGLSNLRAEWHERFPNSPSAMLEYGVAWDVITTILGREWLVRNLPHASRDPYLRVADEEGTLEAFIHQARVTQLAQHLFEAQPVENFAPMARKLRGRSLVGAAAELRVAHLFCVNGRRFRFVVPSGERGSDYDLVVTYEAAEVAVEIKTKDDETPYRRKSFERTLSKAVSQLPVQGPGVAIVHVPRSWPVDATFAREAEGLVADALRRSRRLNGIVAVWEQWLTLLPTGYVCAVKFRIFENPDPKTPVEKLLVLLREIDG